VGIPNGLGWWMGHPEGARWLERLPRLVDECVAAWSLRLGEAYEPASVAYVARVSLADGMPAVLKLNYPEPESEHEGDALLYWGGRGAVRLIAQDAARRALLLERCEPGDSLVGRSEALSLRQGAEILRRLRRPAPADHPFRQLDELAVGWAGSLRDRWESFGRPFEVTLLDHALEQARDLVGSATEAVVLHQDLRAGNILRNSHGSWLAIDPKPLVGDPAFDTASLLRDRRLELIDEPDPVGRMSRRLDTLVDLLDLDRDRMRGWGVLHALAWGLEGGPDEMLIACARWLAAARRS